MRKFLSTLCLLLPLFLFAQETDPVNGVWDKTETYVAITNAHVYVRPGKEMKNATIVIKDDRIIGVHPIKKVPAGAVEVDVNGAYVYPGFIDPFSTFGITPPQTESSDGIQPPQYDRKEDITGHWNESVHPEFNALTHYNYQDEQADALRQSGFTILNTHWRDGLFRGTSTIVALSGKKEALHVLKQDGANMLSIRKGSSQQSYPSSLMGNIALIRQTFYDTKWYADGGKEEVRNRSLEALERYYELPYLFEVSAHQDILRADKIAREFDRQFHIVAQVDAYKSADAIANTGATVILPVRFPKPIDLTDPYESMLVSLEDLKHWELAPSNAAILNKAGVPIAFTAHGSEPGKFLAGVRKSVAHGLPADTAIQALTLMPATILGIEADAGTIEEGKLANLIITSGPILEEGSEILQTWVQGTPFRYQALKQVDVRGNYTLNVGGMIRPLTVKGELKAPEAVVQVRDTIKAKAILKVDGNRVTLAWQENVNPAMNGEGMIRLSGTILLKGSAWEGKGELPNGEPVSWNAIKKENFRETAKDSTTQQDTTLMDAYYPNMAYGWDSLPERRPILIQNATIWTNGEDGIMEQEDLLLRDGKIVQVGDITSIVDGRTLVIDGTGKHVTPGIIDEHSHIAVNGGVNESGQSVSAEVRIGDVVDAEDINLYRQLAGGVTTSQLLHGSANPIGGQSAIVKLKWGFPADSMLVQDAPGFIKFALGENVKQANWGDLETVRFPQSRMGVEQVYYDAFYRAREYREQQKEYKEARRKDRENMVEPRIDLELEALAEILEHQRYITCHSYVQSEILMLMRVADSMDFTLNTFTHILEGYKVADHMAEHGAGASSFSDWWAYKYEVKDAIPYNAAILHRMGIVTAINSDDAEMARRLNQEAAKAVKYGGIDEEEALKMVTLNPAKLLHLDHRIGAIKPGMDADIVIWNGHPLSNYSKPEHTIIEGIVFFDAERDLVMRERDRREKARIIANMLKEKANGAEMRPLTRPDKSYFKCER